MDPREPCFAFNRAVQELLALLKYLLELKFYHFLQETKEVICFRMNFH